MDQKNPNTYASVLLDTRHLRETLENILNGQGVLSSEAAALNESIECCEVIEGLLSELGVTGNGQGEEK